MIHQHQSQSAFRNLLSEKLRLPGFSTLRRVLVNVLLSLITERDFVPMKVQGDDRIDRIGELWDEKERVDRVDQLEVGSIRGPVAIQDTVTNFAMSIDIWMIDRCGKSTFWRERGVVLFHVNVQDKCASRVSALWGALHNNLPERHV